MVLGNTQKVKNLIYYVQRARTVDVQPRSAIVLRSFWCFPYTIGAAEQSVFTLYGFFGTYGLFSPFTDPSTKKTADCFFTLSSLQSSVFFYGIF